MLNKIKNPQHWSRSPTKSIKRFSSYLKFFTKVHWWLSVAILQERQIGSCFTAAPTVVFTALVNGCIQPYCTAYTNSAFHPPWDGKMIITFEAQ